jgi:hypothetical protein
LKKTNDRTEREQLLRALSQFRDPGAVQAGKQMLLSGEIPFPEGAGSFLFSGAAFPEISHLPFEFVKAHYDEILSTRSVGFSAIGYVLPRVGGFFCDAKSEEDYKSFFAPRIDKLQGARHTYSETVEAIDSHKSRTGAWCGSLLGELLTQISVYHQILMTCKYCRVAMRELKGHIFHGKRKWQCPRCNRIRMQVQKKT